MTEILVFGIVGATDPNTGECGPSSVDAVRSVQELIASRYPGLYLVKFVDIFSADAFNYGDVIQAMHEQNLGLPTLVIDGQIRLSGEFSIDQVDELLREMSLE